MRGLCLIVIYISIYLSIYLSIYIYTAGALLWGRVPTMRGLFQLLITGSFGIDAHTPIHPQQLGHPQQVLSYADVC
jgi:hypothetical protein